MSRSSQTAKHEAEPVESFEDRLAVLYEELAFAIQWQRPSILLVFYESENVRGEVERALQTRLAEAGQQLVQVAVDEEQFDIPLLLSRRPDRDRSVYSVGGLAWGGGKEGANAYRALNMRREFFVDYQIRAIFWLTREEAVELPRHAPDFWAFRHRVVEFNDQPDLQPSLWQADEFVDVPQAASDQPGDLDERIAGRAKMLSDLPEGPESTETRLDLLLALAGLYQAKREYYQAVKQLKVGINLARRLSGGGELARFWDRLGSVYLDLVEPRRAVRAFRKALRLLPGQAGTWSNLGRTYLTQDRPDSALAAYRKAVKYAPDDPAAWTGLGRTYYRRDCADAALEAFQRTAQLAPQDPGAWTNLVNLYVDLGRFQDALEACQQATRATPRSPLAWTSLGHVLQMEKRFADAIIAYQKALALDPRNPAVCSSLVACYRLSGKGEQAEQEIQRAAPILQNENEYGRAVFESACGNVAEAIELLSAALEKKQVGLNGLRRNPNLVFLRDDPRFRRLLETSSSEPLIKTGP